MLSVSTKYISNFITHYHSIFYHCYIYIYPMCFYLHICVLLIGYDNRGTCKNANMQPYRDCIQQMTPTICQQDDLFI